MKRFSKKIHPLIFCAIFFSTALFNSCSRKSHPAASSTVSTDVKTDEYKAVVKKPKATFPKIISVNDSAAAKSVDGRLYYDVMGHRYWKNYKDGKYYLFNKSMYSDPAFKKPG